MKEKEPEQEKSLPREKPLRVNPLRELPTLLFLKKEHIDNTKCGGYAKNRRAISSVEFTNQTRIH